MANDLKQRLVNRLKQIGAYDVRIADPIVGFEYALEGMHPLKLWPQCKSVVTFAVPLSPRTNNTYAGPYSLWPEKNRNVGPVPRYIQSNEHAMDRLSRLFLASVTLKGMAFLSENGGQVSFAVPQMKLCAFESGLGVYGRSGIILHPVLGNRMCLGAILTDVFLEPDRRLENFQPCANCDECLRMCPAKAFDPAKTYPHSYSRDTCLAKRAEIEARGLYCHNCFAVCPAGKLKDEDLVYLTEAPSFLKRDWPQSAAG